MPHFYRPRRCIRAVVLAALLGFVTAGTAASGPPADRPIEQQTVTDSLYNAHHPRLLFDNGDIASLYGKVRDGGYDDDAYNFIRLLTNYIYPGRTEAEILGDNFGLSSIPVLGLATFLESPEDETARSMGLATTLYLAGNYDVDGNEYDSALRLRSLALGYDFFMRYATETQRAIVRDEIVSYIDTMTTGYAYLLLQYRPYLNNKSAMAAAALGLAAIVLDGEGDPEKLDKALFYADRLIELWQGYLIDVDGAYCEGVLYAGWSLRHLVYYFAARKRYDGVNYGVGKIRRMENWLAYELLPEGNGKTNNLNDSSHGDDPLPRYHTYFDWAQSEWHSNLGAWLYEHVAGPYGWDWGEKADKPATVLWNLNLPPVQPDSVLPPGFVWEDRGLYYSRSGWQSGDSSDDVLFSFYSGLYRGGHAQEDQNHFTLYANGARFAIDHGPGYPARESASHNMVFIDGAGQHYAGNSIGTDGKITAHVINEFSDFVQGDATKAYATYSPLNNAKYPLQYSDWSWGYIGSNPVLHAIRNVLAVHTGETVPPYFVIVDNIQKDESIHDYQWRMHTSDLNTVDTTGAGIWINAPTGRLIVHALNPAPGSLTTTITPYNNLTEEPDSKILAFEAGAVNPWFTVLLLPGDAATPVPAVTRQEYPWGIQASVSWGTYTDVLLVNWSQSPVSVTITGIPGSPGHNVPASGAASASLETDAEIAVLRFGGAAVSGFVATSVENLAVNGLQLVTVTDGPAGVVHSGGIIGLDRVDADFVIYGPDVTGVRYRSQQLGFVKNGGYVTPDPAVGAGPAGVPPVGLRVRAYPNPFNPSTTVVFELEEKSLVSAVIYDPLGRPVCRIADSVFPAGRNTITWDGRDSRGTRVPTGVYLLRLTGGAGKATIKLTVIK